MTAIKPAAAAGFGGSGKAMIDYAEWDSGFSNANVREVKGEVRGSCQ
jgi:hypothetical protein